MSSPRKSLTVAKAVAREEESESEVVVIKILGSPRRSKRLPKPVVRRDASDWIWNNESYSKMNCKKAKPARKTPAKSVGGGVKRPANGAASASAKNSKQAKKDENDEEGPGEDEEGEDVTFEDVKIEDVKMEEVKIEGVKMEDVKMKDVKLEDVNIEDVKIVDVKIENVKIEDVEDSEEEGTLKAEKAKAGGAQKAGPAQPKKGGNWVEPDYKDKEWFKKNCLRCQICDKSFPTTKEAFKCFQSHEDSLRCYMCFQVIEGGKDGTKRLCKHYRLRHTAGDEPNSVKCPHCLESFAYKSISTHIIIKHFREALGIPPGKGKPAA